MNYKKRGGLSQGAVDVLIRDILKSPEGKRCFASYAVAKGLTASQEHIELALQGYELGESKIDNKLFVNVGVSQEQLDIANRHLLERCNDSEYYAKRREYDAFWKRRRECDNLLLREKIGAAKPSEVLAEEFADRGDFEAATLTYSAIESFAIGYGKHPGLVFRWANSKGYAGVLSVLRKRLGELTDCFDNLWSVSRHHEGNLFEEYVWLEELALADYRVEANPSYGGMFRHVTANLPGKELALRKHIFLANLLFSREKNMILDSETEVFELADLLKDAPSYEEAEAAFRAKY